MDDLDEPRAVDGQRARILRGGRGLVARDPNRLRALGQAQAHSPPPSVDGSTRQCLRREVCVSGRPAATLIPAHQGDDERRGRRCFTSALRLPASALAATDVTAGAIRRARAVERPGTAPQAMAGHGQAMGRPGRARLCHAMPCYAMPCHATMPHA